MRYTLYIEQNSNDDDGNYLSGERSHAITISNSAALEKIVEWLLNLTWLDDLKDAGVVTGDDFLVYDDILD